MKSVAMNVKVKPEVRHAIRLLALERQISMGRMIEMMLEQYEAADYVSTATPHATSGKA